MIVVIDVARRAIRVNRRLDFGREENMVTTSSQCGTEDRFTDLFGVDVGRVDPVDAAPESRLMMRRASSALVRSPKFMQPSPKRLSRTSVSARGTNCTTLTFACERGN